MMRGRTSQVTSWFTAFTAISLAGIIATRTTASIIAGSRGRQERHEQTEKAQQQQENRDEVDGARMREDSAMDTLAHGRRIVGDGLELWRPVVDEPIPDVGGARVVRRSQRGVARQRDRRARDIDFGAARPLRDPLNDVAIPVARLEGHARVHAGGILAQHLLHDAL